MGQTRKHKNRGCPWLICSYKGQQRLRGNKGGNSGHQAQHGLTETYIGPTGDHWGQHGSPGVNMHQQVPTGSNRIQQGPHRPEWVMKGLKAIKEWDQMGLHWAKLGNFKGA